MKQLSVSNRLGFYGGLVALAGSGLFLLGGCASFYPPLSDQELEAAFAPGPVPVSKELELEGRIFHYVDTEGVDKPLVVFVHGAPGAWDAFSEFLRNTRLTNRARLISVDRPGYGRSDLGKPERSLAEQARILSHVLPHRSERKRTVLVGHSFGGAVVARMALDYSDQVDALVMVAASVDPELELTKWYQIPAHWKLFSWMVPRDLYATNEEILPLKGELTKLRSRWQDLRQPMVVIQGGRDPLVPKENADFLERMAVSSEVYMRRFPELSHFIPWSNPDLIVEAILELLADDESG